MAVTQASATVSLSAFPVSPFSGQTVTLTATVAAASPGAGTPTGTVNFYNDGTTLLGGGTIIERRGHGTRPQPYPSATTRSPRFTREIATSSRGPPHRPSP